MNGSRVVYVVVALLFAAQGVRVSLGLAGRGAERREGNIWGAGAFVDSEHHLAHLDEAYLEKRRGLRTGHFASHMEAAAAYARILRTRRFRDTNRGVAFTSDPQWAAILSDCRRLAKTPEQCRAVERLERAGSRDHVASSGPPQYATSHTAKRSPPR